MAKKQNKNAKNKAKNKAKSTQNKNQKIAPKQSIPETKLKDKRTLTKNEVLFFRVGVTVVAIGLVVAAIVMIVNYYMGREEVGPYDDYQHFATEELVAMTQKINDTTYGDLDYFVGKSKYDEFRVVLNDNDVFYFYFYDGNNINEEIQAEIESLENISDLPLIFVDLSDVLNAELLTNASLSHLNLDAEADDMLLIYDMQPESVDGFFELETDVDDIILALQNI
ncbi:hypothetical protein BK011_00325 [Tenericutes bacterium MZ-XQ]|nr:hypothetical protein BK011_00325 [Tenericutes bacterium MZ-XQ]